MLLLTATGENQSQSQSQSSKSGLRQMQLRQLEVGVLAGLGLYQNKSESESSSYQQFQYESTAYRFDDVNNSTTLSPVPILSMSTSPYPTTAVPPTQSQSPSSSPTSFPTVPPLPPAKTAFDPIITKGYKFFNSRTGANVLIKGIDYYPRPNAGDLNINSADYFTNDYEHIWRRDIPQFVALGINAIRLYSVDPDYDHSAFMCALANVGIYVLVELASGSCPKCAITKDAAPKCYSAELKLRGQRVITEFSKYNNTLAFSAGNEVNHFVPLGEGPQWNGPCLKKFVKDMRMYASKCRHIRNVPIGLIMADTNREENTLYYNCQDEDDDKKDDRYDYAEWYGINTYVYCNGTASTLKEALGFQTLEQSFASYNYSIPVLLTEYGCLSQTFPTVDGYEAQRNFNQAKWLGDRSVQNDFAGGLAFEYSIEAANAHTPFPFKEFGEQNYGIGYFSPADCDDITIPCEYKRTPSFYNLQRAYAQAQPENITMDEFEPDVYRTGRSVCPDIFPKLNSFHWGTDWRPSLICPSLSHELFTCPAGGGSSAASASATGNNTRHLTGKALLCIIILSTIITFIVLQLLEVTRSKKYHQVLTGRANLLHTKNGNDTSETNSLVVSLQKNDLDGLHNGYLSIASRSDSE
eukprot:CAMPEP_0203673534 /NCGR_PEP_ID=MMETSP0090-20130426/12879_1 /ASSEMBLY_ACC=CAM_ASM_001088 /TAXON_ID=426623 /ORGANISM="Chaetoceros affinis, Strain CCMP159" /LENGTH=636 /DNA_ID=CAMNT_0050539213 /DNA_START=257 /DNA_END=2167 /DNA_ORIENTATION=+